MVTKLEPCPLAWRSDAEWSEIAERFRHPDPLPSFAMVENFLAPERAERLAAACRAADFGLFCGRIKEDGSVWSGFSEPVADASYVTIHHRPREPVADAEQLHRDMLDEEVVHRFSGVAGVLLSGEAQSAVTCWNPYDFIEPHTDAGDPARPNHLAISLSLTREWQPEHGGITVFCWRGHERTVRVTPCFNTAVLFATSDRSFHLVEQIAPGAPERSRLTWTMLFS